jgi:hypothetical protein
VNTHGITKHDRWWNGQMLQTIEAGGMGEGAGLSSLFFIFDSTVN